MLINFLLFVCALSLSTVAAYYSVVGLATIFAGAFWPIVIMGALLEASKIVLSSWLYRKWKYVPILLKTYLTSAVVILMIITSIGIFGFLSKAHIEQTGQMTENQAQIERYDAEINRQKFVNEKAEQNLKQLELTGTGSDVNTQNQINIEQQRIDDSYKRIQPAIDEQNKIIESQTKIISDQIQDIDKQLDTLQKYIDTKEVAKAQSMVGSKADGDWGPGTASAVRAWQQNKKQEKDVLISKLEDINKTNVTVQAARAEIARIRQTAEQQVSESNKVINRLREQLGKTKVEDINQLINEQQALIKKSNAEIDSITEKKFLLESQVRKLEAEVGPIKYIANLIYGETDKNLLEKSVTWMILVIIIVFDPLAVLMIIAANLGMMLENKPTSGKTPPPTSNTPPDITKTNTHHEPVSVANFSPKIQTAAVKADDEIIAIQFNYPAEEVYEPIIEEQFEKLDAPILETEPEELPDSVTVQTIEELDLPTHEEKIEEMFLTDTAPVLQSAVDQDVVYDIEPDTKLEESLVKTIKLDANEILKRLSAHKPLVRYDSFREYKGYRH